jgi:hypothetical protein
MTCTLQHMKPYAFLAKPCPQAMLKTVVGFGCIRSDWRNVRVGSIATKHDRDNPGSGVI